MGTNTLTGWPLYLMLHTMAWWRHLSISQKVAGGASAAVILGMAFAATIAATFVKEIILQRSATATALYMESFIAPHVQELATQSTLSDENRDALARLFAPTAIGRPVVEFRIWASDRILFGNDRNLIGKTFGPSPARDRAWAGGVSADLDSFDGDEDVQLRALKVPILEIYAPVRQTGTGRIIALAEVYEIAVDVNAEVWAAQLLILVVLVTSALATTALFFGLANTGAREVLRLRNEDEQYRARVRGANRRISEIDELRMCRIGADLHDGPMQLVALALLKLDTLRAFIGKCDASGHPRGTDIETISQALNKTLEEIRNLSASLVPSKVRDLSLTDTITMAARRYESRTKTPIVCRVGALPLDVPFSVKACIYRFVHDGLGHWRERGCCSVRAMSDGNVIEVEIRGNRSVAPADTNLGEHAGVLGNLRDRVEALGGAFLIRSSASLSAITVRFRGRGVEATNG
jgi:signal transduction histidine kinase